MRLPSVPGIRAVFILAALFCGSLPPVAKGATWYVDQAAPPSGNGTSRASAWNSLAAIKQAALTGGDVVLVYPGTYDERLAIAQDGKSATARIIYKGQGRPVIRGINGGAHANIAVIGFEFTQPNTSYTWSAITLAGASRWLIQDNLFHDTNKGGIESAVKKVTSGHIIRANRFVDIGSTGGGAGQGGTVIQIGGDSNLIEYNQIDHSLDRVTMVGTGNVVRNNYYSGTDTALYPSSSPFPFHTDGIQPFSGTRKLLYERNFDIDNRDSVGEAKDNPNGHGVILQMNKEAGDWFIARFNVMIREAEAAFIFRSYDACWIYNSTFINIGVDKTSIFSSAAGWQAPVSDLCDWRNNTWCYMPKIRATTGIVSSNNVPTNTTSGTQHAFNPGPQGVLNNTGTTSPPNLPRVDPKFTDGTGVAGHDDYSLQKDSPLKAAGSAFTRAVNAGTGSTALTVTAAKGLFDGWGIADADHIKIGAGPYVQIAAINYETNVVTLTAPRAWKQGDPVIVKGMEDIGALPYAMAAPLAITNTTPFALAAGPVKLTATAGNVDAVRYVEFLVDGLPVGMANTPPYSVPWNSDGHIHNVEARAYNAWASRTLMKSSFNTFGREPVSQTAAPGGNVTFAVAVNGTAALQWQKNGVNIAGATNATLTLKNISPGDAATYTVIATNAAGTAISQGAVLNIASPR